MTTCPLCQNRFNERSACQGCGLMKGCALIKCPKCGYEFVEKSKVVNLVKKILNRFTKKK